MNALPFHHHSPMVAVIRPADASTVPLEPYQALIAINALNGEATSGWSRFLLMPVRFYLVTNRLHPSAVAFLRVHAPVHDVAGQRTLPIAVECHVRAEPGQEHLVAEGLHGNGDPTHAMYTCVQRWIYEYTYHREGALLRAFEMHRGNLAMLVAQQARAMGLDLEARVAIADEEHLPAVLSVGPHRIGVYLADCPDAQALEIRVDLALDPGCPNAALAQYQGRGSRARALLGSAAQFMTSVRLREFAEDLDGGVRARLAQHLDAVAKTFGRRVAGLVLRGELQAGDAEATRQLALLCSTPHVFGFSSAPPDGLEVAFHGAFSVLGVAPDAYRLFAARRPDVDLLRRELAAHARALLATVPFASLCRASPEQLLGMLNEGLRQRMRIDFGLQVVVRRLERAATYAESNDFAIRKQLIDEEQAKLLESFRQQANRYHQELGTLMALRDRLVKERAEALLGDLGPMVADIDRKIQQVDERIRAVGVEIGRHRAATGGMLPAASAPRSTTVVGMLCGERPPTALPPHTAQSPQAAPAIEISDDETFDVTTESDVSPPRRQP